jgi:hypothetical protein
VPSASSIRPKPSSWDCASIGNVKQRHRKDTQGETKEKPKRKPGKREKQGPAFLPIPALPWSYLSVPSWPSFGNASGEFENHIVCQTKAYD